jgi:hypothetical protein
MYLRPTHCVGLIGLRRSGRMIDTFRSSFRCAKEKLRFETKVDERAHFRLG